MLQSLETNLVNITFIFLCLATILYIGYNTFKNKWVGIGASVSIVVATATSTGAIALRTIIAQHPPFSNLYESALFIAWATLVVYVLVEFWYKFKLLGIVVAPVSGVIIAFASLLPPKFQEAAPLMPALQSYWLKIHVTVILFSYAAGVVAFAAAILYLIFANKAKQKPQGVDEKSTRIDYPALFDDLTFRSIMIAFPLLTLGLITGAIWANYAWGTYWSWDPKEDAALVTWLIYLAYFHLRFQRGWEGKKLAVVAIIGFVAIIFTYVGVNLVGRGLHSYGWFL